MNVMSKASVTEKTQKMLGFNEIKDYLPHRYPFIFVDKVLDYQLGKSIHAIKNVTGNENFFNGHFPSQPIMPGVLMIEALAQTAGMLYFLTTNTKASEKDFFYLAGVDKTRFKRIVYPGDQLHFWVEMGSNKLGLWLFNAKATVDSIDGDLACSAELKIVKGVLRHD